MISSLYSYPTRQPTRPPTRPKKKNEKKKRTNLSLANFFFEYLIDTAMSDESEMCQKTA